MGLVLDLDLDEDLISILGWVGLHHFAWSLIVSNKDANILSSFLFLSLSLSVPFALILLLQKALLRLVQQHLNHLQVLQNIGVRRFSDQRIQRKVQVLRSNPLQQPTS